MTGQSLTSYIMIIIADIGDSPLTIWIFIYFKQKGRNSCEIFYHKSDTVALNGK
jgi:hypothetical protein